VMDEFELLITRVGSEVGEIAGDQIVHSHYVVTVLDQPINQMRAQKPRSASDKDPQCPTPR
jgi:hypothetical protein